MLGLEPRVVRLQDKCIANYATLATPFTQSPSHVYPSAAPP